MDWTSTADNWDNYTRILNMLFPIIEKNEHQSYYSLNVARYEYIFSIGKEMPSPIFFSSVEILQRLIIRAALADGKKEFILLRS